MPNPNPNESMKDYMDRCMSDPESIRSFPKDAQRYAVCMSKWKNKDKSFSQKYYNLKALDVDTHTKRVKVAIAELESIDRDNDVFDPSAFDKTIKENGPKGTNEIWHLLDHSQKTFSGLGKFSELGRDGKYITGVSNYKDSFAWREVAWPLYEAGDITQHSVGFETLDEIEPKSDGGPRIIKSVRLYEGSAVLWGANPNTPTMEVVKRLMNNDDDEDITASEKIDQIIRKIKNQKRGFTEEDSSLLIIELKYLQKIFDSGRIADIFRGPLTSKDTPGAPETDDSQEKTTEPEIKATQPETVVCPHCKKVNYNSDDGFVRCRNCNKSFVPGVDFAFIL